MMAKRQVCTNALLAVTDGQLVMVQISRGFSVDCVSTERRRFIAVIVSGQKFGGSGSLNGQFLVNIRRYKRENREINISE